MSVILPIEKQIISYSRYNSLKQCPRKFYEQYISDSPEIPEDNHRAYIGIMVQYIFETIINNNLHHKYSYNELCNIIDQDLKLLKPFIRDLANFPKSEYNRHNTYTIEQGTIIKQTPLCLVETSINYIIYIAQNSIIKKIREHYKESLKYFLNTYNLDNMQCELKLSLELHNRTFSGTIDFIEINQDHIKIIDGKKKKTEDKDAKSNETRYLHNKEQMIIYKLLAENHFNLPVTETGYFYYDKAIYEPCPITQDDINKFIIESSTAFDLIEQFTSPDQFEPKPSYIGCLFCPIIDSCPVKVTKGKENIKQPLEPKRTLPNLEIIPDENGEITL